MSLRDFSAERFHALCRCEAFLAEQSHDLCHCETFFCGAVSRGFVVARLFVRSDFTLFVIAKFICRAVSRCLLLRGFSCGASHPLCRCETFLHTTLKLTTSLLL